MPARRPRSWPPPRSSGARSMPSRTHERADARRAAELVRRQAEQIGAERRQIERQPAGRLHRVAMKERAVRDARARRSRATGWMTPGLVVGEHDRDQRRAGLGGERAVERGEIDDAVGRRPGSALRRAPPAAPNRARSPTPGRRRPGSRSRARWLASVPPLVKTTPAGAAPTSAATARAPARPRRRGEPAPAMHRGGIADLGQRRRGGAAAAGRSGAVAF